MKLHVIILIVVSMFAAASGFAPVSRAETTPALSVIVSIVPQVYVVERIGGDLVKVEALVQPGQNPHTYEPSPRQLAALSGADLYFRIGVAFENGFIPKLQKIVPNLPVVDTRRDIPLKIMGEDNHACSHDPSDDQPHDHGHGVDPHIWLSPILVSVQALTIRDALIARDPEGKNIYDTNCSRFVEELQQLDSELKDLLSDLPSRKFMVYHPAWGYFADTYQLDQIAVEIEGKTPPAKQLARIIDQAKAEGIRVIFTQPQFSTKAADTIADAIKGRVVPIDPLAKDLFANLRAVAAAIKKGAAQ
jgi:zinc transport system substrate-binding protein